MYGKEKGNHHKIENVGDDLLSLLFITNPLPREEEDMVLHCVDDESDSGQEDEEEDDDEGDDVVLLHFCVSLFSLLCVFLYTVIDVSLLWDMCNFFGLLTYLVGIDKSVILAYREECGDCARLFNVKGPWYLYICTDVCILNNMPRLYIDVICKEQKS